jgi:hypothetical protein
VTNEQLTAILATHVMGWSVGPERFLLGNRQWITRSHFQPLDRVQDAFRLLHKAATGFSLSKTADGVFTATVRIEARPGTASSRSPAATITVAVARALGLDVPDGLLEACGR